MMDLGLVVNKAVWTTLQMFAVLLGGDIAPGIDLRLAFGKSVLLAIIGGWSVVVKEVSRYRLLKAVQRADNPLANRTQAFLERRDR